MERTSTLLPRSILLILHNDEEMAIGKRVDDSPSTTTPTTTAILGHQLLRQLKTEALDVGKGTCGTVVLHENESVIATLSRKVKMYL